MSDRNCYASDGTRSKYITDNNSRNNTFQPTQDVALWKILCG